MHDKKRHDDKPPIDELIDDEDRATLVDPFEMERRQIAGDEENRPILVPELP